MCLLLIFSVMVLTLGCDGILTPLDSAESSDTESESGKDASTDMEQTIFELQGCTVDVPFVHQLFLRGYCQPEFSNCPGGSFSKGSCNGGQICCIATNQCERLPLGDYVENLDSECTTETMCYLVEGEIYIGFGCPAGKACCFFFE